MGYLPLDDLGATIFFQPVSARYERGSIILTSNKSYGDWGSIFGEPFTHRGAEFPILTASDFEQSTSLRTAISETARRQASTP
jgi:hypothetical protein